MRTLCAFALTAALAGTMAGVASAQSSATPAQLTISSSAFQAEDSIPPRYTCKSTNTSPPLRIGGIPVGTKSLVLIVDDPDAPDGLFTHWLVWNITPTTTQIIAGTIPRGARQGTNDFEKVGYGGPCPPSGTHRYFFRVFALDRLLDLRRGAGRKEVDQAIEGHVIAAGEIMAHFSK